MRTGIRLVFGGDLNTYVLDYDLVSSRANASLANFLSLLSLWPADWKHQVWFFFSKQVLRTNTDGRTVVKSIGTVKVRDYEKDYEKIMEGLWSRKSWENPPESLIDVNP